MLGEKIGEFRGKTIGLRIVAGESGAPCTEVSMQGDGSLLGVECRDTGTYIAAIQQDGSLKGEGRGITITKDGEAISWNATGVGRPRGTSGATSFRGSVTYQTTSKKLARLNSLCVLFEHEVDDQGNQQTMLFEWR